MGLVLLFWLGLTAVASGLNEANPRRDLESVAPVSSLRDRAEREIESRKIAPRGSRQSAGTSANERRPSEVGDTQTDDAQSGDRQRGDSQRGDEAEPRFQFQLIDRNPFRSSQNFRYQFGLSFTQAALEQQWTSTTLARVDQPNKIQPMSLFGLQGAVNLDWAWGLLQFSTGMNQSEVSLNGANRPAESRVSRLGFGLERQTPLPWAGPRSFAFGGLSLSHWLVSAASSETQWLRSTTEWGSIDLSAGFGYAIGQGASSQVQIRLGAQYAAVNDLGLVRFLSSGSPKRDLPQIEGRSVSELSPFLSGNWFF